MKFVSVIIFFLSLSFSAFSMLAEEPVQPDKTRDPAATDKIKKPVTPDTAIDPVQPDKHKEVKPDENEKKSPFSPSTLMRIRAQKPPEEAPPATVVNLAPVTRIRPVLEGVLVRNNQVLASFRVGNRSIVVEPRNTLMADDVKYTFVGYADEIATLRDEDGRSYELRVVQPSASSPQHTTEAGANSQMTGW